MTIKNSDFIINTTYYYHLLLIRNFRPFSKRDSEGTTLF